MKRVDLEKHLRSVGAVFLRYGGRHDRWGHPANGTVTSVPRHREVASGTVKAICRDLGVSAPPNAT